VTRDTAFAGDFFRRYVEGRESPDYGALLASAGFLLRKAQAGRPWLGGVLQTNDDSTGVVINAYPAATGSLYAAGLDRGDVILSLDGQPTLTGDALSALMSERRAGDVVAVEFVQRGEQKTARMTLVEHPALEAVPYEGAGMELTPRMRAFREAWLASRVGR
jgi:predicted metalloprotease with PDZ domain